ncbi:sigma-70 family RNA polymerase sigma factor [Aquihabitans sp. G128]|nr:sigma-70 family RNA polymerase sigma factor [Aquihabitans sp. G128]
MDDVWRYCASIIGPARADDATQETLIRVVKALPRFRGESSARTWLLSITRFVCIDDIRARGRQKRIFDKLSAQPFELESVSEHHPPELLEVLGLLRTDQREAFVLTQIMALPYQEAADLVGCPIGTIRSRVARARAGLIELLDEVDEPLEDETAG